MLTMMTKTTTSIMIPVRTATTALYTQQFRELFLFLCRHRNPRRTPPRPHHCHHHNRHSTKKNQHIYNSKDMCTPALPSHVVPLNWHGWGILISWWLHSDNAWYGVVHSKQNGQIQCKNTHLSVHLEIVRIDDNIPSYSVVLYCVVLYCNALRCIVLPCIVMYCNV